MKYLEEFKRLGPKPGGTVKGWLARHDNGSKWIIKFPEENIIAQNEVLAGKLYAAAGVMVPRLELIRYDGHNGAERFAVGSKFDANLEHCHLDNQLAGLMEGFLVDAWLANWDVVGLEYDNVMRDGNGGAVRVDLGGSILFRAQGEPKGKAFGPAPVELMTLLDKSINPQSSKVFKAISVADVVAGMKHLEAVENKQVRDLVAECMLPEKVANVLIDRKEEIIKMKAPDISLH